MPTDGNHQQVYGAQHPPSIKRIRELAVGNSSSSQSTAASGGGGSSGTSLLPSYRDYEKKSNDAWDIDDRDDDDDDNDGNENNDSYDESVANGHGFGYAYSPQRSLQQQQQPVISIADSDAMAKQVIRSHQEKQQQKVVVTNTVVASASSVAATANKTSPKGPGPGKAQRQETLSSPQQEQQQSSTSKPRLSPTSISSDEYKSMKKASESSTNAQPQSDLTSTHRNSNAGMGIRHSGGAGGGGGGSGSGSGGVSSSSYGSASSSTTLTTRGDSKDADEQARLDKFKKLLSVNPVDLNELQKACWKGIPKVYRHICWKLLSDYLPLNQELQEKTIEQKRNAYWEYVAMHYGNTFIDSHHDVLRQILNDIPRMNPLLPIFQNKTIQDIFQRVLYVWAVRHPGSGYVQGINDLLTPFFVVFLNEYTEIEIQNFDIDSLAETQRRALEADCYWCMNKLLERIQENYVFSQPGIQKNIRHLEYLIKRIDAHLYNHLKKNGIEFIQFAFRWMNNLLMREIPLACTIRLWDTYHAEPFGFSDFHLYVCAAFLLRFSKNICEEKDFQGLMMTLQNLPTKNMKASDIELLTAEAYQLQVMFANSPNHTSI